MRKITVNALFLLLPAAGAGISCDAGDPIENDSVPVATITLPGDSATFRAGDTIHFSGAGEDPEDGDLPATSLTWWAELHHDSHTHPFLPETVAATGEVVIPRLGETSDNIWYRFYLRVVDSDGRADTVSHDIIPLKSTLTITSARPGLQVTLDGQPFTTPYSVVGVVGMQRELGTPLQQSIGDSTFVFQSWSDGGTATHTILTPDANTTYTATYAAQPRGNRPPSVQLTAPAGGAQLPVSVPVALTAMASDSDGAVTVVRFHDGATVLGVDSTSPYAFTWTPTALGAHSLYAVAVDNDDSTSTSALVNVTVVAGGSDTQNPTVALTSPTDGTTNLSGALTFTATATDNVGVAGVVFQVDGIEVANDSIAPYSAVLPATTPYATGVHVVRVRSRDAAGNLSPWVAARVTFVGSDTPAGFVRTTVASGMNGIGTGMAFAPDGRLFVCEQDGQLRVIKNGVLLPTPFLSLTVDNFNERGLLGVAFHPNFTSNNYIYVYYTTASGGTHNRISRFTANGDVVVPASESVLVNLPPLSSAGNHNGGALAFGTDGKLYVAVGENANGPLAQSDTIVFGKMLRFNADGSIPTDNPFYSSNTGLNRAIWAKGLRNPFTFAIQPGTGRMHINDVGQSTWEEINLGAAGANYGWPTSEGATSNPAFTTPIYFYGHGANPSLVQGAAIVGGTFYNPATVTFPAHYVGQYFFGDLTTRFINRLDIANGNAVYAFARLPNQLTNMGVGPDGSLYVLTAISGQGNGVVRYAPQ